MRELTSFIAKISVSVFFLVYLFNAVSWEEVWGHLKQADPFFLFLYLVLGFVGILISSIKWLVLARPHRISPSLSSLVSLYLVGYFFNNFLPTSIGGDVVRGHALGRACGKKTEAMASVFMERFTGFTALVVFALLAVALDSGLRTDLRLVAPIGFAVVVYIGVSWAMIDSRWLELGARWIPSKVIQKVLQKVGAFQQAVHMYRHARRALLLAGGYSILFYLVSVLIVYVGCLTFNTTVSFTGLLAAVPVLLILFMIPFSFGGIGLQEWAYYFVLETVGVPAPIGLSLGLLFRARSVGFGIIGGALYPFVSRTYPLSEVIPRAAN